MYIAGNAPATKQQLSPNPVLLWPAFILYVAIAAFTMAHHELWGDELHSWNMAKNSGTFYELLQNRRYEGHPHAWYMILWLITRCTHDPVYMQWVHLGIAAATVALILFRSPFPLFIRILIPLGYYFIFEYTILSRNYAPGILCGVLLCIVLTKQRRFNVAAYYILLLVMSYTHLLALVLAGCLHVYFLLSLAGQAQRRRRVVHWVLGGLIFLSALYFIKPPGDSDLSVASWMSRWGTDRLAIAVQSPLRAFVPMPAWWQYHCWNTQFLLELHSRFSILKLISPLLAAGFAVTGLFILKKDPKALAVFLLNMVITFIIGNIYPLGTQRYAGFIFVGFIMACWICAGKMPFSKRKHVTLALLLGIQIIAGAFMVAKDVMLPFSNAGRVKEPVGKVPPGQMVVTDYWGLIALNAYMDKSYYCVDLEEERSFILWDSEMIGMRKKTYRYYTGIDNLFQRKGLKVLYMVSTSSPEILQSIDQKVFAAYRVEVAGGTKGSIEKWSNLYLYRISAR